MILKPLQCTKITDLQINGMAHYSQFHLGSTIGVKGIGCASISWAAADAGKPVDEVEACLDILCVTSIQGNYDIFGKIAIDIMKKSCKIAPMGGRQQILPLKIKESVFDCSTR